MSVRIHPTAIVEDGAEHFAGAAPLGPEVDEDGDGGVLDFGVEVFGGEIDDGFVCHGGWDVGRNCG